MRKHLGKRERVARKSRKRGKSNFAMQDALGMITLKLGRKKFSESFKENQTTIQLQKKFRGCVVDAER
jgi:hypothetical protein